MRIIAGILVFTTSISLVELLRKFVNPDYTIDKKFIQYLGKLLRGAGITRDELVRELCEFVRILLDCVNLYPPRYSDEYYEFWLGQALEDFLSGDISAIPTKQQIADAIRRLCESKGTQD